MDRNIWITSDTHYNHNNIIKYSDRPFSNTLEMNECLRDNWNETVKPGDIVYNLGDVYIGNYPDENYSTERFLSSLHGRKRLILGNHDNGLDDVLRRSFQKITMWRMFKEFGLMLSHVPLHPGSFRHKCSLNVHGHLHKNIVTHEDGTPDDRYLNVCVEKTDYKPINLDELKR